MAVGLVHQGQTQKKNPRETSEESMPISRQRKKGSIVSKKFKMKWTTTQGTPRATGALAVVDC